MAQTEAQAAAPTSTRPKLYLVDGSGYIFRAYYAVRPLSTRHGVPTNAVVGFAKMLGKLIREHQPALLGIAFDRREPTFRHDLFDGYKANRDAPPEDLAPQFDLIHELVAALSIPKLSLAGFEADDIIATLAQKAAGDGYDVVVVSGDKDLLQLVGPHVSMYDPMKDKHYDRDAVIERFGVPPEQVVDVQGLAGDSSDNIPGVPKVGPKTAAKLISAHGSVDGAIAALQQQDKLKAAERSLLEHAENARLSKQLATLATDAPCEFDTDALAYSAPQRGPVATFLQKIEAFNLMREMGVADGDEAANERRPTEGTLPAQAAPPTTSAATGASVGGDASAVAGADTDTPAATPHEDSAILSQLGTIDRSLYQTVTDLKDLQAILHAAKLHKRLSVDLETTSLDPTSAEIVGVALCVTGLPAAYVPVGHRYIGAPDQLDAETVLAELAPILADKNIGKVGQNLKYDMVVLARHNLPLHGLTDDAMLAAYVLDASRASYGLDALARELLGHETIRYADVAGKGKNQLSFDEVPVEEAAPYAAEDADVALRLCNLLGAKVKNEGLSSLYRELELPLVPILADMERTGVRIDVPAIHALSSEFATRLQTIEKQAQDMLDEPVNLASPKQLAHLFFEKLGYPVVKKTKTGYSTDQEVLETLARDHELPKVILEHRLLSKLRSTYVDALPKMVNPRTGRLHTSFNQTGTATGRLSSSDPNLQNIPIRSEDGRRIRSAFIPTDGWVLISADYSQIELRVLAHLSGDPSFVEAFKNGEDIHARTAREILGDVDAPPAELRRRAKAINFGILYGLSQFGLAKQLGIPRAAAKTYIQNYFARYPGIRTFLDDAIAQGRSQGYVSTMAGRRRYLPALNSRNHNARQGAERIAMNTPIQGSAADLIKMAMLRVHHALSAQSLKTKLILQVHDELVLEAPEAEAEAAAKLVQEEMCNVLELKVPLEVDVGTGKTWSEAH